MTPDVKPIVLQDKQNYEDIIFLINNTQGFPNIAWNFYPFRHSENKLSFNPIKGEHWCKTISKRYLDWVKTQISTSAVLGKYNSYKRNKPLKMKNLHFLTSLLVVRMYFTCNWDAFSRRDDKHFGSKDVLFCR